MDNYISKKRLKSESIFIIIKTLRGNQTYYHEVVPVSAIKTFNNPIYQGIKKNIITNFDYKNIEDNFKHIFSSISITNPMATEIIEFWVRAETFEGRYYIEPSEGVKLFSLRCNFSKEEYPLHYFVSLDILNKNEQTKSFVKYLILLLKFNSLTRENIIHLSKSIVFSHGLSEEGELLKNMLLTPDTFDDSDKLYLLVNLPECEDILKNL